MRSPIIIIAITLIATACGVTEPALPPRVAILQANYAQELLEQCSRPSPSGVSAGWDVSAELAAQIEADLPKLSEQFADPLPQTFYRQYVGIVQSGKRLVYINAFATDTLERHHSSWESVPVGVCDGGDQFWGAVYDPATHTFSALEFNRAI